MTVRRCVLGLIVSACLLVIGGMRSAWAAEAIDYGRFRQLLDQGRVSQVVVGPTTISGVWHDGAGRREFVTVPVSDPELVPRLMAQGVSFRGEMASSWPSLWMWLLPLGILLLLWSMRTPQNTGRQTGNLMSFGQTRARRYEPDKVTPITFRDVAGIPEAKAELQETVEFLKEPGRFTALGGRMPKGVLLVGPPGTGKTLLARAVAGEAGVPFFSLSGSEFVELFVGVGASRVRDLFQQARDKAPCLIFIDELDAIGKARSSNPLAMNDEREHTLNQLLAEMDGFDSAVGVLVLASTNRPETLDAALLRPGRFDRQVMVSRPDLQGRAEILAVHAAKVKLAPDVDLHRLARRTVGLVGADLANLVNEGALLAARHRHPRITNLDLDHALERVVAGLERPHLLLAAEERLRVSLHEAGHALVACLVDHADPVERVSLIPRGMAGLGYTWQVPVADQYLQTRTQLLDRIAVLLGGRAAEELALGEASTGAGDDLQKATAILRQMVCHYGLSQQLGPQAFPTGDSSMLGGRAGGLPVSEALAERIDAEIQSTLEGAYQRVKALLASRIGTLADVARVLRDEEELDGERLRAIVADSHPRQQAA